MFQVVFSVVPNEWCHSSTLRPDFYVKTSNIIWRHVTDLEGCAGKVNLVSVLSIKAYWVSGGYSRYMWLDSEVYIWQIGQICLTLRIYFFFLAQQTPVGQGFPIQITHNDAPQSVGLLWMSDQPVVETFAWQHTTITTDRHPCSRWDSNPQSQQASGRRPTP